MYFSYQQKSKNLHTDVTSSLWTDDDDESEAEENSKPQQSGIVSIFGKNSRGISGNVQRSEDDNKALQDSFKDLLQSNDTSQTIDSLNERKQLSSLCLPV